MPVEPRDASTVVLLRDGDGHRSRRTGGLEVYLLRRRARMAFAAGVWVFPGGGVDPRDFDAVIGWEGPAPQQWGELMGTAPELARALVCAAVRETFEESGVLLAGPPGSGETAETTETTGADWEEDRRRLEARELGFPELLARRGLALRTDLLRWWGSWVTPATEPRRYDTRFFLARLPPGQATRDVTSESDQVGWLPVGDAVAAADRGDVAMLPPTYLTCLELHDLPTVEEALAAAARRDRSPVRPELEPDDQGGSLRLPERFMALEAERRRRRGR